MQLLVDRNFGVLFWGKLLSLIAAWALMVVVVILAYDATGSAAWAGAMAAAQSGPQLVLTLVSGRLSDTYGPLSQIVAGTLMSGVAALSLLIWWLAAAPTDGPAVTIALLIASVVFGSGIALSAPAMHSVVPRLVTGDELSSAVALNFFPTALARTLGPAGGAILAGAFGPVICLTAVSGIFLASGALFLSIRLSSPPSSAQSVSTTIVAGLHYVVRDRVLLVLLFGVAAVGFGAEPAITLAPALAERVGGGGSDGGLVTACFGGGGLTGVFGHRLLRARLAPAIEGCVAMAALATAMTVAASVRSMPAMCVSLAVGGAAMVVGITAFSIAVQQRSEPTMLGRVMALWVLAFAGVRPAAGPLQGYLADAFSARIAVLVSAALTLVAAGIVFGLLRVGQRLR